MSRSSRHLQPPLRSGGDQRHQARAGSGCRSFWCLVRCELSIDALRGLGDDGVTIRSHDQGGALLGSCHEGDPFQAALAEATLAAAVLHEVGFLTGMRISHRRHYRLDYHRLDYRDERTRQLSRYLHPFLHSPHYGGLCRREQAVVGSRHEGDGCCHHVRSRRTASSWGSMRSCGATYAAARWGEVRGQTERRLATVDFSLGDIRRPIVCPMKPHAPLYAVNGEPLPTIHGGPLRLARLAVA